MLIELARGLGLRTVAEGVETADVADWLRKERVDMMQGYFFAKPSLDRPWLQVPAVLAEVKPAAFFGTPPLANVGIPAIVRTTSLL